MNGRSFIAGVLLAALLITPLFSKTREASAAAVQNVIYLVSTAGIGNLTFTVPFDWNNTNTIECIGSGGKGGTGATSAGGGGAYAKITNLSLTPGNTLNYAIGASATTSTNTGMWRETYFNGTASSSASISCAFGRSGASAGNGAGGSTANSTGTTKFAGGSGAAQKGGGGAAGLNGAGSNGSAGDGGSGDAGFGGAGGGTATVAAEGEPALPCSDAGFGMEYAGGFQTGSAGAFGSGGGGGGGVVGAGAACAGGNYGGGGGGGNSSGGNGVQGLIIITYTPSSFYSGILAMFKIQGGRFLIRGGRVLIK